MRVVADSSQRHSGDQLATQSLVEGGPLVGARPALIARKAFALSISLEMVVSEDGGRQRGQKSE